MSNFFLYVSFLSSCPFRKSVMLHSTKPSETNSLEKIGGPNQTSSIPSHPIPVRHKPNSVIPSHSRQAKADFFHSKPFQSSLIPSHSGQPNIVNKSFLFSLPCRSWSPNYSVLVVFSQSYVFHQKKKFLHFFTVFLSFFLDSVYFSEAETTCQMFFGGSSSNTHTARRSTMKRPFHLRSPVASPPVLSAVFARPDRRRR
jgi:hypothetical protein